MSEESKAQADFVKALGEMTNPPKNRIVNVPGKYKFEYADLAIILDTVRPVLAKNGLAVSQPVAFKDGKIFVTTKIRHVSGVVVEEATLDGKDPGAPQQQGSLISYLRRYQLVSILGITADDDDDANAAQNQPAQHQPRQAAPKPAPDAPTAPEAALPGADLPPQTKDEGSIAIVREFLKGITPGTKGVTPIVRKYCGLDEKRIISVPSEQAQFDAMKRELLALK